MQRTSHLGAAAVAAIVATGALFGIAAQAGTLDDVRKSGALRIAYREDAPPFSFKPQGGGDGRAVLCQQRLYRGPPRLHGKAQAGLYRNVSAGLGVG